ncbi:feruloyl-CoA synthase [Marinobacter oulmenensis]|uniref:Feruloyl-CoA synthase n=1 Tax=Marinobacter oulmenensis TaxID=643747 RepID=A0A840UG95_9GAMM|nr:feruloyl-CoA synthase [Marinobacter oulmenensis]MBB5321741.1 feruloyl-CoA synthase [Marinobacter oulmenensis]
MLSDFHPVNVVSHSVDVEYRNDGSQVVRCDTGLDAYARTLTDRLELFAEQAPDRVFLAQRASDEHWQKLTYAQALKKVRAIASWLLTQDLSAERPVAILSGNSTEHLLMALGAMYIGVPYSPISTAYSLISTDFGKLRHVFETITPGLIFVDNLGPYRDAIDAVAPETQVVAINSDHALDDCRNRVTPFADLLEAADTEAVDAANDQVDGETIAKFLFTSGSTGLPKAVINTQGMLCANQVMINSVMAFLKEEPPVMLDWLPWNHTFGGNHNAGIALYNGGTLYIDGGKPTESAIGITLNNLREVAPTVYFNVPKGFELLVKKLQEHPDIARSFFSRLKLTYFAAAGLSQHIWDALDELAIQYTGKKVPMLTGLGSTETAPAALFASIEECASGVIGVPAPGVAIKLVPNGGKLEARIKAPTIMPGYWRAPELTAKAYDDEGYYCLGDAFKYLDPDRPERGFRFDGRVSEDFKLDTGTWVSAGTLRAHVIHFFAPYVQDVVITGHNKSYVGALVFPDWQHCRELVPAGSDRDNLELARHPHLREVFQQKLEAMAEHATGSSTEVKRMLLLTDPPDIDRHEITDKGSINQRAVLENRAGLVDRLYSTQPDEDTFALPGAG